MSKPLRVSASRAPPGSKHCYTYISTQVEAAQETTYSMRVRGKIDADSYCLYLTAAFVPENESAKQWSIAGNTGDCTGSGPSVPEGAMEYSRCSSIAKGDGWHGALLGTSW